MVLACWNVRGKVVLMLNSICIMNVRMLHSVSTCAYVCHIWMCVCRIWLCWCHIWLCGCNGWMCGCHIWLCGCHIVLMCGRWSLSRDTCKRVACNLISCRVCSGCGRRGWPTGVACWRMAWGLQRRPQSLPTCSPYCEATNPLTADTPGCL
jgi:hypothetical protein